MASGIYDKFSQFLTFESLLVIVPLPAKELLSLDDIPNYTHLLTPNNINTIGSVRKNFSKFQKIKKDSNWIQFQQISHGF